MIHSSTRTRLTHAVDVLLRWHNKNRRSFIWRGLERSPYIVLVSEFMLQQTGAKQVEIKLPIFLRQFPTLQRLASAQKSDVLRAWQGLGYNRRALNLHKAAQTIQATEIFPDTLEGLRALPGVGRYTASAILCFSKNADVPVVDVNIERVLSRWWKRMKSESEILPVQSIYELNSEILPHGKSAAWHEALMDLGSTICTKRAPKCAECPVRAYCASAGKVKLIRLRDAGREPIFWGQPRRIWRGRILKIVVESGPLTARKVYALVKKQYEMNDSAFVPFVISILDTLTKEGFLVKKKEGYSLAHE